ncbi:MAG: DUF92 domain-containing protein [Thermoanaerobaculia bacterium]|nr:DUF92 domain-containing protein [Thermoanaerobaculia bacterium]
MPERLSREGARKLVHISFGFFAFSLRWLTTGQAALVAFAALLFNRFVLPRVGGKRIARTEHGYDLGIVIYPLAVLILIVSFPTRPELAAVAWITLAFGDGMATLVGRNVPLVRLPWNRDKSWSGLIAFVAIAFPVGCSGWIFVAGMGEGLEQIAWIVFGTVLASAFAESLVLHLDDNIVVPLTSGLSIALLSTFERFPSPALDVMTIAWLSANAFLAVLGYFARSVSLSGMAGGFVLGSILIAFAGWQLYVVLLIFFIVGSVVTKLGYRRKEAMGLAQEEGGRRGFCHAFSNVGIASILALSIPASSIDPRLLWLAAFASLATATADTTASEIGQLYGRRAFLPLTFRRVPTGTEGAISYEGTVAGAIAAMGVAVAGIWLLPFDLGPVIVVSTLAGSAILGSWIESVAGSWNRKREQRVPNGALNFFNTLVGALIAFAVASIVL